MPATGPIEDLFAELDAEGWLRVRDAVDGVSEKLRHGTVTGRELVRVAERLAELSVHPKWEVRKSVANAIQHLRHRAFDPAVARLLADENAWVRDAACEALGRRRALTRLDVGRERYGEVLLGWLSELETAHGPKARDAALRLAERYQTLLMGELYHEVLKVLAPLDLALAELGREVARPRIARRRCVERVERARSRALLIREVVASLREMTEEVPPTFRPEALAPIVRESVEIVQEGMGVELGVELDVAPGITIEANRPRLVQAFTNIVKNAAEAYEETGRARWLGVEARMDGEVRVVLSFRDRGRGMTDEALADAFQLFSSGKPRGLGMGLKLARRWIERVHRGSVALESVEGQGTTVSVALPIEQEVPCRARTFGNTR